MCTALSYKNGDHYFGRNLDLEYSYCESVTVTPRRYQLRFRKMPAIEKHYAMIGMAYVKDDYPLYYDGVNEMGLGVAALSFPYYARYGREKREKANIAAFEFIPWILAQCKNAEEAAELLKRTNVTDEAYSAELPPSPLHWMISDKERSLTAESTSKGLEIHENPVGVLTNSPPFKYQLMNLNNYMSITRKSAENCFYPNAPLKAVSRGMGGRGLPGDFSSQSRFVRAAFVKGNSVSGMSEEENISQFFHILGSVEHPAGSVELEDGKFEITVYSSCCSTEKGIYYYTTYGNRCITAVDMHRENLDSDKLASYPLITEQQIYRQNQHE